ncbi:MAG: acyl-CoA dehydrogenase [Desulfobacteraceae bacterium]|nr:MAG: acyl-CoA dehydrogenase [Desulfobacteraceae bacterium]
MITPTDKELKLIDKASAEFAKKELAPKRAENDQFPFGPFFEPVLGKAFALDFFHTVLPESIGGMGQGICALSVILRNLCREDSSLGGIVFTNAAAQILMLAAEAGDTLSEITGKAGSVRDFLIAFPVFNNPSEIAPAAVAKKRSDGYKIDGRVDYVVLGGLAAHALIPARIEGVDGFSFFLIDPADSGASVSPPIHSLGLNACPAVDLALSAVRGTLVGAPGQGAAIFDTMTDRLSVAEAAMSAGVMKGSFQEALEYAKARQQGGREIIGWSGLRMILANMAVHLKNAEMIITRAGQAVDAEESGWQACSRAAAIHVQAVACDVTTDGIQVLGGVGYMKDFGQEKRYRDAKHLQALLGMAPMKKLRFIEKITT